MTPCPSSNSLRKGKRTRATPFSQYPSVIPKERLMGADSNSCLSFSRWADRSLVSGPLWGRSPSGKGTGTSFGGGGGLLGAGFTGLTTLRCLGRTLLVGVRRRAEADLFFVLLLDLDRLDATRAFVFLNTRLLPNPTSVQVAGTLGTGIVNVDHLDFRIEVKSGGSLLSIADSSGLDASERYLCLTTGSRGVDVGDSCLNGIHEPEHLGSVMGEDGRCQSEGDRVCHLDGLVEVLHTLNG